jgi:hypothetical protein
MKKFRGHLDGTTRRVAAIVGLEYLRSHVNLAFGLTRQGFSERCEVSARRNTADRDFFDRQSQTKKLVPVAQIGSIRRAIVPPRLRKRWI